MSANGQAQASPASSPTKGAVDAMLLEQRTLTQLGLHDLRQRWAKQPPRSVHSFGEGEQEEQTIRGNPTDAFHGVVILNPTGKTISVGFQAGGALGSPLIVPPGSALVWAAEFQNVSLAAKASGPVESVVVLRLFYPPAQPMVLNYAAAKASVTHSQVEDVAVKEASVTVLAANTARLGMEIVNRGAKAVRLALGVEAEKKHGLWIAKEGGSWNGMLSAALWLGSVNAICDEGETTLAVVEC
jgi:hypothetical protein